MQALMVAAMKTSHSGGTETGLTHDFSHKAPHLSLARLEHSPHTYQGLSFTPNQEKQAKIETTRSPL